MGSWTVIGHNNVTAALDRYLERAIIPHALLFSGPEGVGKRTLAEEFLKKLLKTPRLDTHTDAHIIDAAAEGFDIDRVRGFMESLRVRPFQGGYTVGVIDNAQVLTPQASSALLKTLEEPNPETVLILIASTASLLPTIVSRSQVHSFGSLSREEFSRYISVANLPAEDWMLLATAGSPGRLHRLLAAPEYAGEVREVAEKLFSLSSAPVAERLIAVSRLAEVDETALRDGLVALLERTKGELTENPQRHRALAAVLNVLNRLRLNANKKMALERLCLDI